MPKRSPARWAAPAALAAAALAVYVVISPYVGGDDGGSGSSPAAETAADRTTPAATTDRSGGGARTTSTTPTPQRTYVVQPGDTFSSIATANGMTVEELQRLNPDTDSASLTVGERIVLRDDEGR